jgi:hypothetical protein
MQAQIAALNTKPQKAQPQKNTNRHYRFEVIPQSAGFQYLARNRALPGAPASRPAFIVTPKKMRIRSQHSGQARFDYSTVGATSL